MRRKFGKDCTWDSGYILADRQTDRQTYITILLNPSRGPSKE